MFGSLRHRRLTFAPTVTATAAGYRLYAIGDIHGRIDLLRQLLTEIERDNAARPARRVVTILIGDLIDRGFGSAALLSALAQDPPTNLVCLLGNHEAALIDAYDGNQGAMALWLEYGGRETLRGFGGNAIDAAELEGADMLDLIRRCIPWPCVQWLRTLPTSYINGDYFFAHAGVRPGRRLSRQRRNDLLWVRDQFLDDERWHGKMVVHGHTPSAAVEFRPNRIGIDTGAYASGRLSALGLQDRERWVLHT